MRAVGLIALAACLIGAGLVALALGKLVGWVLICCGLLPLSIGVAIVDALPRRD